VLKQFMCVAFFIYAVNISMVTKAIRCPWKSGHALSPRWHLRRPVFQGERGLSGCLGVAIETMNISLYALEWQMMCTPNINACGLSTSAIILCVPTSHNTIVPGCIVKKVPTKKRISSRNNNKKNLREEV
jgi:hypothetical protein